MKLIFWPPLLGGCSTCWSSALGKSRYYSCSCSCFPFCYSVIILLHEDSSCVNRILPYRTVHLMCQPKLGFLYDPKLVLSGWNYLIEVFVLNLSWFTSSILMSILSFVSEIFVELGWKLYLLRSSGIMQLLVLVKLLVWLRKV